MIRRGSLALSAGMIVLSLAFVLPAPQARAQSALDATCTGEAGVPWSEQVVGCTKAIESGRYTGRDLAKALILRAKAHGQVGDIDRCLADIEEAIRLDPTNAVATASRGDVHLVRKDYARAVADYTKAAELDPRNALVLVARGIAYIASRDLDRANLDRAMADFEEAQRLQPSLAQGLYWRGVAKRLKGDVAAGEADIAAARTIDPNVDR